MRAALRRRSKQQLEFRYDPSSYALNFDDGCCHSSVGTDKVEMDRFPVLLQSPDIAIRTGKYKRLIKG
ncbi:hypothetical protein V6N11_063745 [Hibiscus sabdariffa]|uniref:Uncharacterized protein n=1 Tax=Hibiscus sabdariffa TaxID=183260 RepID=A0ABR2PLW9_9ROSI